MNNIMPVLEVKPDVSVVLLSGADRVRPERRQALALRWLTLALLVKEKTMEDRLANELLGCYEYTGASVKKKEDMHRMAEANKHFAHYRF